MKTILPHYKRRSLAETLERVDKIIEFAEKQAKELLRLSKIEKDLIERSSYEAGLNKGIAAGLATVNKIHDSKKILFDQLGGYISETCQKICHTTLNVDPRSPIFKESIKKKIQLLTSELPADLIDDEFKFKLIVPENLAKDVSEIATLFNNISVSISNEQNNENALILETENGSFEINQFEHLERIFLHLKESINKDPQLINFVDQFCDRLTQSEVSYA